MKAYYSLIKISPNSLSEDNITIGMFLFDGKEFHISISKHKKQVANSLLNNQSLLDFIETELTNKINELNKLISKSAIELFEINNQLNFEYVSYLSRYSNGVLKFSKPVSIADNEGNLQFNSIFNLLVDNYEVKHSKESSDFEKRFYDRVKSNLLSRVENKVHINQKFTNKQIPSLLSNFEIDCIGLNGSFTGAKSLILSQSKETINKNISIFTSVLYHLSYSYKKSLKDNNLYLIADEPDKSKAKEHKIWKDLRNDNLFKVISSDDSYKVAEKIEETHAHTFLV